jgi:uncharacterized damage-inducible protein DinB
MPGEARHFVRVLQRIVRTALAQVSEIAESDLNRPLDMPSSNTAFVLATHLIGSAEYWVLELVGGREVHRERSAEFRAVGDAAALTTRYERWLEAMQEVLEKVSHERLDQLVDVPMSYRPTHGEAPMTVRDALLHVVEHCALHQGHLELTRQLLGYEPAGRQ